jgi:hypothetical protein
MFITGKALLVYLGIRSEASIQELKAKRLQKIENEQNAPVTDSMDEERRPAKIFTLKKNQQETDQPEAESKKAGSFFGLKKKQKESQPMTDNSERMDSQPEVRNDSPFNMEEIKPDDFNSIPIHRGVSYKEESISGDKDKCKDLLV